MSDRKKDYDWLARLGRRRVCPGDVLEEARCNAIVSGCVQEWQAGACTWEEAMMHAVLLLAHQNEKLLEAAVLREVIAPGPITVERRESP